MLPRRWRMLAPNLGQGSPLQELLRINHRSRLPDGQDIVCRDPMVTDVLPDEQVLQRILHHSSRVLDTHQSLPLMSRRRHQDVLLARIRAAQLCLRRAGYHTSHRPGDAGGISGNSPCSEQEPAQRAFSGGKQTTQFSTKLLLIFAGPVCCSIFTWDVSAHPFCQPSLGLTQWCIHWFFPGL